MPYIFSKPMLRSVTLISTLLLVFQSSANTDYTCVLSDAYATTPGAKASKEFTLSYGTFVTYNTIVAATISPHIVSLRGSDGVDYSTSPLAKAITPSLWNVSSGSNGSGGAVISGGTVSVNVDNRAGGLTYSFGFSNSGSFVWINAGIYNNNVHYSCDAPTTNNSTATARISCAQILHGSPISAMMNSGTIYWNTWFGPVPNAQKTRTFTVSDMEGNGIYNDNVISGTVSNGTYTITHRYVDSTYDLVRNSPAVTTNITCTRAARTLSLALTPSNATVDFIGRTIADSASEPVTFKWNAGDVPGTYSIRVDSSVSGVVSQPELTINGTPYTSGTSITGGPTGTIDVIVQRPSSAGTGVITLNMTISVP